jgi:hypothetical protein
MCCCQLQVSPLLPDLAASLLAIGRFEPVYVPPQGGIATHWHRILTPSNYVEVNLCAEEDRLVIYIRPAISNYAGHAGKRDQAAMALELAARYAEKADGIVTQMANVDVCRGDGLTARVLAQYPSLPMQFDRLCLGLQALFVSEGAA